MDAGYVTCPGCPVSHPEQEEDSDNSQGKIQVLPETRELKKDGRGQESPGQLSGGKTAADGKG